MSDSAQRFTEKWDAIDPFDESYPHLWVKAEHLGRYQFASRYLGSVKAKSVIDIGCGLGYGAVELARNVDSVLAIDSDAEILEYAKAKYGHPWVDYRAARIGTGELSNIFRDESVPAVVAFETLEHMSDPAGALLEFATLLRREGTIIVSVPGARSESINNVGLPSNREHRRIYTVSSISELLESAGFQILEVLGQPLVGDIARNEARLVRRKQIDGRVGDEPALHSPVTVRRLAATIGQPEPRDIERSYAITVIAERQ